MPDLRRSTRVRKSVETVHETREPLVVDSTATGSASARRDATLAGGIIRVESFYVLTFMILSTTVHRVTSTTNTGTLTEPNRHRALKAKTTTSKYDNRKTTGSSDHGDNDDASQGSKEHESDGMELDEDSDEQDSESEESEADEKLSPLKRAKTRTPPKATLKTKATKSTKNPPKPATSRARLRTSQHREERSSATVVDVRNNRQKVAALTVLAKKALTPLETPETSLTAALLLSFRQPKRRNQPQPVAAASMSEPTSIHSYFIPGVQAVARRLLHDHHDDGRVTDLHLVNLILRCVGGKSAFEVTVDLEEMTQDEWADKIAETVDEMEEIGWDQILLTTSPKASAGAKDFQLLYAEFWYQFASLALTWPSSSNTSKQSSGTNSDDRFNVEWVRDRLARISELLVVGVPDIRLASTIAVYQMGRAMLDQTKELTAKVATTQRQLSVATRNKQQRKIEALTEQVDSWKRIVNDLEYNVKEIIIPAFCIRFKDSNAVIRVASMETINAYGCSRPDIFAVSLYLKYCGWMLSDKDPNVRIAAIQALIKPVQNKVEPKKLTAVVIKFLERLTDCVLDVDVAVQEAAMDALLTLLREEYFNDVENDRVWSQINLRALAPDTSPLVRRNALAFVMEQLSDFEDGPTQSERAMVAQLTAIASWIAHNISDGDIPTHLIRYEFSDLLVASLRDMSDYKHLVCHWSAMLNALKGDDRRKSMSKGDQRQHTVMQRVLLRMLVTSVQMEVPLPHTAMMDSDLVEARDMRGDLLHVVPHERKKSSVHEDLTTALLRMLPDLLISFKTDTPMIQSLTTLPEYFLPSVLNVSSRGKEFRSLLTSLSSIFYESTDDTTLKNCCRSIATLARGDHSRSDDALLVLKDFAGTLRPRLFELLESNANGKTVGEGDDKLADGELSGSISLCLRRLCILTKRWSLIELLGETEARDADLDSIGEAIATYLRTELEARRMPIGDGAATPAIWSLSDDSIHSAVSDSISSGTELLLILVAWRLREEIHKIDEGEADYGSIDLRKHVVVRLRDRLLNLLVENCFEHYIDPSELDIYTEAQQRFSIAVQESALGVSGDIRTLFPRKWTDAKSPFLVACAIADDSRLSGVSVRFVRSQVSRIKECKGGNEVQAKAIRTLLYPVGRALGTNWKGGNRREAACVLTHIVSGQHASEYVQEMTQIFKRMGPIRLMEAYMACLRTEFDTWASSLPEELSDRPTDEEMKLYEEQTEMHRAEFDNIREKASLLSSTLSSGKKGDVAPPHSFFGFVKEGIRFAFSTEIERSNDHAPLGSRLVFLSILSKFLVWIRKHDDFKEALIADFNEKEGSLRSDPDFSEIFDEDMDAIADFRKVGDLGQFTLDDGETYAESRISCTPNSALKPRTSMGSSVSSIHSLVSAQTSLSPIREEDASIESDGTDEFAHEHKKTLLSKKRRANTLTSKRDSDGEEPDAEHDPGYEADNANLFSSSKLARTTQSDGSYLSLGMR